MKYKIICILYLSISIFSVVLFTHRCKTSMAQINYLLTKYNTVETIKNVSEPKCDNTKTIEIESTETITEEQSEVETVNVEEVKSYEVCAGHSFKSYTNYKLLGKNSPQGKLQSIAYTDENGLRKVDDCFCVALGSYYGTTIGTKYHVTTDTGNEFNIILCDCKADTHTDSKHQYTISNGCMTEFYVDMNCLNHKAKVMGNISYIPGFDGNITSITEIK